MVISRDVGVMVVVAKLRLSLLSDLALPYLYLVISSVLIRSFYVCGIQVNRQVLSEWFAVRGAISLKHTLDPVLNHCPKMKHSQTLNKAQERKGAKVRSMGDILFTVPCYLRY